MVVAELLARALDLREPWVVRDVTLIGEAGAIVVVIDFERGARFVEPGEEGLRGAYDTHLKLYRHLNFF